MSLLSQLYTKLYMIRAAEEAIQKYYSENEMKTPMHMSAGSEAIAVGVCQALEPEDQVLGSYRSHALYLAKSGDLDEFFLEIYGKIGGGSRGKAGSMHICKPAMGHVMSSAIVASHIPVAAGVAFANKFQQNGRVSCAFFGDGALGEGSFWETLNAACLMSLPLLLVCEDNGYAVHTNKAQTQGYKNIDDIAAKFNCNVYSLEAETATDAEQVFAVAQHAIQSSRTDNKPSFLRIPYYRYLEHVGIHEDFHKGYRTWSECDLWKARDPLLVVQNRMSPAEIQQIERDIDLRIENSLQLARQAKFSNCDELYKDVFYE